METKMIEPEPEEAELIREGENALRAEKKRQEAEDEAKWKAKGSIPS